MASKASIRNAVLATITESLEPGSFQIRPFFPNLLNQPDLLIVPTPGRLTAIYVYDFGDRISWRAVLGAVEDLFELKTTVGAHAIAVAILIGIGEQTNQTRDIVNVIMNTFDAALPIDEGNATRPLIRAQRISRAELRASTQQLWLEETYYARKHALRRFSERDLAPLIDLEWPGQDRGHVRDRVFNLLQRASGAPVVQGGYIESIKPYIGGLQRAYRFKFDFVVEAPRPKVVDIVPRGRSGIRDKVRYLMAKARLIRYRFSPDGLFATVPDYRPILVITDNLRGPNHDPYRYVRALFLVGWQIARQDQSQRISGFITDEDL
jgi:hypothetical protein